MASDNSGNNNAFFEFLNSYSSSNVDNDGSSSSPALTIVTTLSSVRAFVICWALLLLFCVVLVMPSSPLQLFFAWDTNTAADNERYYEQFRDDGDDNEEEEEEDPKIRKAIIDRSLAIKQVVAADEEGNLTLGDCSIIDHDYNDEEACDDANNNEIDYDAPVGVVASEGEDEEEGIINNDTTTATILGEDYIDYEDEEEEEDSTCVICLEPFRVGDIVAWSRGKICESTRLPSSPSRSTATGGSSSTSEEDGGGEGSASPGRRERKARPQQQQQQKCHHVFHRDCLMPWLIGKNKDDCPACRTVILRYGEDGSDGDDGDGDEKDTRKESAPTSGGLFIIVHGLVSRARKAASYSLVGSGRGRRSSGSGSGRGSLGTGSDHTSRSGCSDERQILLPNYSEPSSSLSRPRPHRHLGKESRLSSIRLRRRFSAAAALHHSTSRFRRASSFNGCQVDHYQPQQQQQQQQQQTFASSTSLFRRALSSQYATHTTTTDWSNWNSGRLSEDVDDLNIRVALDPLLQPPVHNATTANENQPLIEGVTDEADGMIV